jgi:uncharacterized protein (TIGR02996 family)
MRRFTYSDAKSHKFWAIDLKGNSFTVTFGKVGTAGQSQTKSFPTADKAKAEAEKLVKEKTGKGYVEEGAAQAAPKSDREVLRAAVLANPEDLAAHAALADYLLEQGDTQGELIRVQLALEDETRKPAERKKLKDQEKALLKAHGQAWLGPFADAVFAKKKKDDWRHEPPRATFVRGLLARVEFPRLRVSEARAFVASPASATVRELMIEEPVYETAGEDYEPGPDTRGASEDGDGDAALRILGRWKHLDNIRVFRLGEPVEEDYTEDPFYGFNCRTSGDLAPGLVRQMPNLEELYLLCNRFDTGKVFSLPMPRLRVIQVYHATRYPLDKLANNASLGTLTHLLCHPHALDPSDNPQAYIRLAGLRAICRSRHLRSLTHLRLRIADFGDDGIAEIIDSGLIKRLKVLDLRHGVVTDKGAQLLAACPDARNLDLIELRYNTLTANGVAALKRAGLKFAAGQQWARSDEEYEDSQWLYAGDIE